MIQTPSLSSQGLVTQSSLHTAQLSLWEHYLCGVTYLTLVGFFSCVYQIVLLEVSQLREAFIASLAFKWSLSAVYSEVHLGRNKAISSLQSPVL